MFKILANVGDDLIVGTHKGNVGVMSKCIMEDEGLVESSLLGVVEAQPHRDRYLQAIAPKTRIDEDTLSPMMAVPIEIEHVELKAYRYGSFMFRTGYSPKTLTWIKSRY